MTIKYKRFKEITIIASSEEALVVCSEGNTYELPSYSLILGPTTIFVNAEEIKNRSWGC